MSPISNFGSYWGKKILGETIGGLRPKPMKPEPEEPGVLKWFLAKIGCIDQH
jgi:hypothetical protein